MSRSFHTGDYGRFDELADLAQEFARRYRLGERPSLEEHVDRLPEMADHIREIFPALVEVEQIKEDTHDDALRLRRLSLPPLGELGDYRIVRQVGRGGMGVVYEAEQISLGRRVALKVLPNHVVGDGNALERFRREAKAAARLHHTNIVPVFEVGREGDIAFYAMQFIRGSGLNQVIDELARLQASSAWDGTVRLWDLSTGLQTGLLRADSEIMAAVAYSPDGDRLATANRALGVALWNTAKAQREHTWTGSMGTWNGDGRVAFSPDGALITAGGPAGPVRLWDVATKQPVAELSGHQGGCIDVAFTPDGAMFASAGGQDMAIRLWDVTTRKPVAVLRGHTHRVNRKPSAPMASCWPRAATTPPSASGIAAPTRRSPPSTSGATSTGSPSALTARAWLSVARIRRSACSTSPLVRRSPRCAATLSTSTPSPGARTARS